MWMFEVPGINMHSQALFTAGHGPEKLTAVRVPSPIWEIEGVWRSSTPLNL